MCEDGSESAERQRLYERHRDDLSKRQISNAENLDKSILTYSGAGLALSLGFLKDFIPIRQAEFAWALYGSWIFFTLAMVLVVVSYVLSLRVVNLQLDRAERYYLKSEEKALGEQLWWDFCANHVNHWMSAAAFAIALIFTTFFVSVNLGGANVAGKNTVTTSPTYDGITGMAMQKVQDPAGTVQRGLTGLPMQSVKPAVPSNPAPAAPSTGNTGKSGS
ncbi:hypothetical protein [Paraburkholderia caballeronis]|uniref:Transmembrane protein n=1 Tax=Paraburkholderia caballeronis TaxID=416943 RepID=A0A1H7L9A1_9BURK|nr:hypothetical protein [Paraburkholderia caballeronis]PXW28349.1 hypothetical protein C7403_102241 [Paraburkholderia caballeronis]PXX03715.1 hypothetical protein C7407_102241 [Paraburkholderia caballeronis]RAK04459.1 hypothetical protein C7409_102241 [Paraburkholderia caballeronis]SED79303.1 hypothetical protein SAMN05445871_3934 [Paraburkholderia caballeronis]SEK95390.1 hypothetical protein SAMN05192542_104241 [Paraburkholderia caballeronis]